MRRAPLGVLGLVILLAAGHGARGDLAMFRRLPADPEPLTAAELAARRRPCFVALTDARFRRTDPPIRSADGHDVPIVDAAGRVVALGHVPFGAEERALDEAPWGVATPVRGARRYLGRLARDGLDVRGVPGLMRLHAQREPGHYAFEAACAAGIGLLLGLPLLVVGFAPAPLIEALVRRLERGASPTRDARLVGTLFLGLATLGFLVLCFDEPGTLAGRLTFEAVIAVAGWVGAYLVVAPGARPWPRA